MKTYFKFLSILFLLNFNSCGDTASTPIDENTDETQETIKFYYGADLSYVNEMIDCGATYKNSEGVVMDPYKIFSSAGTNLVRVRLWNNPTWTNYSNFEDVKLTISRAKSQKMKVLLDFHYSDTWADPGKQEIPAAWLSNIDNTTVLSELLYNFTFETLTKLAQENLLPEMVQVGNEINAMILQQGELKWPINWERNTTLINSGIKAVRDVSARKGKKIEVMLHIAQPENALWWFSDATKNGITDFDWIGLSYYPIWSEYKLNNLATPLKTLIGTYKKRLMIVETAYPFTLENADSANNILDNSALVTGYPASEVGQLNYLIKLKDIVKSAGGEGIVYWEPAWVSTNCSTLWGKGSHWENAALFNFDKKATLGMSFYNGSFKE